MTNYPPVEVYETIAEMNHRSLDEAIREKDFDRMHRCFNRLTHALEQVEQYRMEQARKELRERGREND